MDTGLALVWALALVAIAVLGAVLNRTLQRSSSETPSTDQPLADKLLFQYELEGIGISTDARVIVHIPGIAWGTEWHGDLIRLEVIEQSSDKTVFTGLGDVEVLAVYDLAAFRMTDPGADIRIERFMEPIEVILTTEYGEGDLGVVTQADRTWILAPAAEVSPRELRGVDLPPGRRWAAAAIARLGRVCLVRMGE